MSKLVEIKTKENDSSVEDFLNTINGDQKRKDSLLLLKLIQKITKEKPKMWGSSMIGFGNKRYKSPATGREVDWFRIGFSPRKTNLSLHLVIDMKKYERTLKKLGKHKTGAGCLYINQLSDIDMSVLEELINVADKLK
jgi:hypothetical protein